MALLILFSVVNAQDFRDVSWGASKAEVRAAESTEELGEEEGRLYFESEVGGKTAGIVYDFLSDGRLAQAYYIFNEEHSNKNDYIDDFNEIEEILKRVYGPPDFDNINWKDDLYQDDPSEYGFAVSIGHVVYGASYNTETTAISHILTGNNYEITHITRYDSIELQDDVEQQQQESEDDAF